MNFVINSSVWHNLGAVCASAISGISGACLLVYIAFNASLLKQDGTLAAHVGATLFLMLYACIMAMLAYQSTLNKTLVAAENKQITFRHNAWRRRSVTLSRDMVKTIEVDTQAADNDGGTIIISVSSNIPGHVRNSKVWTKVREIDLYYDFGGADVSATKARWLLKDWLSHTS